jgi:hypothetical protein
MEYVQMRDQYVLLTGSKNNAGDFFIKFRAKQLFKALRPDRGIVDYDAWKPFTREQLEEVNRSKALILMGGPALQTKMRPNIYPMTENLDDIRVPIITMGIGWKSPLGDWDSTHNYNLNAQTFQLLQRVERSGFLSSVRDYHTLNTLYSHGFQKFVMTGCPALYSLDHINKPIAIPKTFQKVSYSMGVGFTRSVSMREQMKSTIICLRDFFDSANFMVVFHHSTDKRYLATHGSNKRFWDGHQEFIEWLRKEDIPSVDISGSAERLIDHYRNEDLHIGYRIHAHIFMSSISKPSILINEDGRGKALRDVIGGFYLDAYHNHSLSIFHKILIKLRYPIDTFRAANSIPEDLTRNLAYEIKNCFPRLSNPRTSIDRHFKVMKSFIGQLP